MKEELYSEAPIEGKDALGIDVENYNKHKNHFSKSTADDDEINVNDLENIMQLAKNNRSSSHFGDIKY